MAKLLTVFGATGQQGGSVINSVLKSSELSRRFNIRGITRDASKPSSQGLQKRGVEVVQADADDQASLPRAVAGSNVVFIITNTIYDDKAKARELAQGKAMADAAVAAGAELLIFSTLPNATQISGGRYTHILHFDAKAEIEGYIRSLPIKSAFVALGSFMQNLNEGLKPRPTGDGTYAIFNCFSPETQFPLVDARDLGNWVAAILTEPDKHVGAVTTAATRVYTIAQIAEIMSSVLGKTVAYQQLTEETVRGFFPASMSILADDMVDMALYFQDFGYFGPEMKTLVEAGSTQALGRLTTLEEYLSQKPAILE